MAPGTAVISPCSASRHEGQASLSEIAKACRRINRHCVAEQWRFCDANAWENAVLVFTRLVTKPFKRFGEQAKDNSTFRHAPCYRNFYSTAPGAKTVIYATVDCSLGFSFAREHRVEVGKSEEGQSRRKDTESVLVPFPWRFDRTLKAPNEHSEPVVNLASGRSR